MYKKQAEIASGEWKIKINNICNKQSKNNEFNS